MEELLFAAISAVRASGKRDLAWVIEYLSKHPEEATKVKYELKYPDPDSRRPTIEETLRFFCSNDLSRSQYQSIRMMSLKYGKDIYPTYHDIQEGKKACYPDGKYFLHYNTKDS